MGTRLQGEPFIHGGLRINVIRNGMEGGMTREGESQRNNSKRTGSNTGQVILSMPSDSNKAT